LERIFALGKINRILKTFIDSSSDKDKTNTLDKRLLKGFYVNDEKELENDSDKESRSFGEVVDATN